MVWYISEKMRDFLDTDIILNTNLSNDGTIEITEETKDQFIKMG
jgi:hypothetical protein